MSRDLLLPLVLAVFQAHLAGQNQQPGSIPPVPSVPFDLTEPEVLVHNGALDARIQDMDGDGDMDLVTFNHPRDLNDHEDAPYLQFWANMLLSGAQPPNLFVPVPPASLFDPSDLEPSCSDPMVMVCSNASFSGIYELVMEDFDGDAVPPGPGQNPDLDMILFRLQAPDLYFEWDSSVQRFKPGTCLYDDLPSSCGANLPCPATGAYSTGVAFEDVNGDGHLDFVACYRDIAPRYYHGNGDGTFSLAQVLPTPGDETSWTYPNVGYRDIQLKDINGDTEFDCALGRQATPGLPDCASAQRVQVVIFFYDPTSDSFEYEYKVEPLCGFESDLMTGSSSLTIELHDMDGDGDEDLVQSIEKAQSYAGCVNPVTMQPEVHFRPRIYLNDGAGNLGVGADRRPSQLIGVLGAHNSANSWAYPVDYDGDGDEDVIVAHHVDGGVPDRLWRNEGLHSNGTILYSLAQEIPSSLGSLNDNTRYVRFGDLDLDGDLDYVETNFALLSAPPVGCNPAHSGPNPRIFYGNKVP